jgi:hypothetical protein
MSDSSYGSVYVEGVTYIDEREIAKRDAEIERLLQGERAADAEIERLRGELDALQTHFDIKAKIGDEKDTEIKRLRGLLADAPCTCPNSPPWDWPHDPHNEDCYLNRVR